MPRVGRAGLNLMDSVGRIEGVQAKRLDEWVNGTSQAVVRAVEEGDIIGGPDVVADTIVTLLLGVEQLSTAVSDGKDMLARLSRAWQMLLPSIAEEDSLEYFQQYLSRESVRFNQADPSAN